MLRFRLYFDKDVEQEWLNKMSNKGFAFNNFCLGFYTFEACKPGEYNYQIDLLDNWKGERSDFSSFMDESGVEVVSQWYRWVFLRKKSVNGPFEMYTDTESKIEQYSRIRKFFKVGLILELIVLMLEVLSAIRTREVLFIALTVFIGIICLTFLRMIWKCSWKIEELKR